MKTLATPYGNFNIYLNYLTSIQGNSLHISFVDKHNHVHMIIMEKSVSDKWEFDDNKKYPLWILSLKNEFETLIAMYDLKQSELEFEAAI